VTLTNPTPLFANESWTGGDGEKVTTRSEPTVAQAVDSEI